MNFAWIDCCGWDSSLLWDCKLIFRVGSFTWEAVVT